MDALNEFLGLCDADPDFDSGSSDNDEAFERISRGAEKSGKVAEMVSVANSMEYQNLFGSPIQINLKLKQEGTAQSQQTNATHTKLSVTSSQRGTPFNSKSDDSVLITDPYSHLRLFKNSVQLYFDEVQTLELGIKERNLSIPYTPLEKVFQIQGKIQFWTCGVLVKKASGQRQSAKGNDYSIWEISDLESPNNLTLFLFGGSATSESLKVIPVGSLIDLTNPSIMPEKQNGTPSIKLSVSLASQIRNIGTARDFGFCGSRRKDGKECMNPVNKFKCDVCIHHASAELRKLNSGKKSKTWAKKSFTDNEKMQFAIRMESQRTQKSQSVTTVDFGKPARKSLPITLPSKPALFKKQNPGNTRQSTEFTESKEVSHLPKPVRMELQDNANSLRRSSSTSVKDSCISFSRETCTLSPLSNGGDTKRSRKEVNLTPAQTKHLSDRDRFLLGQLVETKPDSDLPGMLTGPNAGSQNFLKFLSDAEKTKELNRSVLKQNMTPRVPGPLVMTGETLINMKKAISFIKTAGPIPKRDPNSLSKKRKLSSLELEVEERTTAHSPTPLKAKTSAVSTPSNGHLNVDINSEEFQRILNAKSVHANIAEANQEADYFNKLERKEAIENKLLSTFSVATTAFMCRECKYVALSQSDLCKERGHLVRAVKAVKRFFKCKDCGNRTMSLDRLPKRPCTQCKSSNWLVAPVGREKSGPTLDSERLSVRGDEEKFLGSTSAKLLL